MLEEDYGEPIGSPEVQEATEEAPAVKVVLPTREETQALLQKLKEQKVVTQALSEPV